MKCKTDSLGRNNIPWGLINFSSTASIRREHSLKLKRMKIKHECLHQHAFNDSKDTLEMTCNKIKLNFHLSSISRSLCNSEQIKPGKSVIGKMESVSENKTTIRIAVPKHVFTMEEQESMKKEKTFRSLCQSEENIYSCRCQWRSIPKLPQRT